MCRGLYDTNDLDSEFGLPEQRYMCIVTYLWLSLLQRFNVEINTNYISNMMILCCPCNIITIIPGAIIAGIQYIFIVIIHWFHNMCLKYSYSNECCKCTSSILSSLKSKLEPEPKLEENISENV
jgi:hypothetical protein